MNMSFKIYNSLSRKKEEFKPLHEGFIGIYVCGPTVYSDVHLGNVRTFISFDLITRYMRHLGYKVRYVRNITDVGHLEGDADTGAEDKIGKKARLEQLEPMEIVERYTLGFHDVMRMFNVLPPNIEPRATGHLIEQIETVKEILKRGYAYEVNGSVYFDTLKYAEETGKYGELSGRKIEELIALSREDLKNQDEKRHPSDFAIWIKADPSHLMRWPSPWSVGFPGWHLECSVMSTKYLGETFDIHGGGSDLKFPHHENEIAQNYGACGHAPARYWMHTNMLLMNGRKMSKSDGNTITPLELISGNSPHISKGYHPMVIRFFMLQSHYRSTLDLSDEALQAAEKGFKRLMEARRHLLDMKHPGRGEKGELDSEINRLLDQVYEEMSDDFNAPKALARLFELVNRINALKGGQASFEQLTPETFQRLQQTFPAFISDVLGLEDPTDKGGSGQAELLHKLIELLIELRQKARQEKNWAMSDFIRDALKNMGVTLKDGKDGTEWVLE